MRCSESGHRVQVAIQRPRPNKRQHARGHTDQASGNQPDVHIVIRVPGKEIVVSKELDHAGHKKSATDAYAVLDNAFAVAASRLKDYRRITHGEVKYKSGEPRGAGGRSGLES